MIERERERLTSLSFVDIMHAEIESEDAKKLKKLFTWCREARSSCVLRSSRIPFTGPRKRQTKFQWKPTMCMARIHTHTRTHAHKHAHSHTRTLARAHTGIHTHSRTYYTRTRLCSTAAPVSAPLAHPHWGIVSIVSMNPLSPPPGPFLLVPSWMCNIAEQEAYFRHAKRTFPS
jgi:hypothetical protein